MPKPTPEPEFDDPIRGIGHDSTATFDNSPSNPTDRASSEALNAVTAEPGDEDDEDLDEDLDDDFDEDDDDEEEEDEP